MKNLKIGKKLSLAFGMILVFFIISAITAIYSLQSTSSSYIYFYEKPYKVSMKVMDMRRNIQSGAKFIMYAITSADLSKTSGYLQDAQVELTQLEESFNFVAANSSIDKSVLDNFKNNMASTVEIKDKVFKLVSSKQNTEALKVYFAEYYPKLVAANDYLMQINDYTLERADKAYYDTAAQIKVIFAILIGIIIITFIATIYIGIKLAKGFKLPIIEIEKAAQNLAQGKLNEAVINYESKDELGSLAENMRITAKALTVIIQDEDYLLGEMAKGNFVIQSNATEKYIGDFYNILQSMENIKHRLSDALSQINESSDQVSSGSDQVSSGAQALSQGATEQASSVEELAATINDISSQIKTNSTSAQIARSTVDELGAKLLDSNQQMQEMTEAMGEISSSSAQIGKIIKTIEDIAFQTNILALNAAVEAARAGEAGKGFAVVADEVRNLANKSSDASKSTSALIESSLKTVEHGARIATGTAASLLTVVEGAHEIMDQISRIAMASEEQAQSIKQVSQGIDQISSVVQTNSATAEESAAASEELSTQAQMLKSLVSRFKLQ